MEKIELSKPRFGRGTNTLVFQQLRAEVKEIVEELEPKRKWEIKVKALLIPVVYLVLWLSAMIWGKDNPAVYFAAYLLMGLMIVVIFLNVVHDAVHGTIFKSRRLNNVFVYLFDLVGANSFIWRMRHIRFHHNYPNVNGWDTDIDQSTMFRIFPSATHKWFHKYQHLYMPFVYPLFLFNWLIVRDFRDFFSKSKTTVRKLVEIPASEYVKLFLFKGFFFFYTIFLPKIWLNISWGQAIGGFVIMVFAASLFSLMVLLPPHANTESEFPVTDEQSELPENWFMHMLLTTNDVEETSWFVRTVLGNFNYHVVHHLFPNVNNAYYPEITHLLQRYAEQHDLPYRRLPLLVALKKHFMLLRENGLPDFNIWEESM
jgi:linoleoyl-CoA desaturase